MYKLTNSGSILRISDNALIPTDPANTDFASYLEWVSKGNAPDAADHDPRPVYRCDPWQIRKALTNIGLRQQVEDAVSSSDDIELKDGWAHSTVFSSNDPFVISIGTSVGKTTEEIESVIKYAGTL